MNESVRVVLADHYDLVVGDTFQLYYNSIVEAPNPYCYSIVAICEKGKNFPRYFEFTPISEGCHKLTVQIYNSEQRLLGESVTYLNVTEPKERKTNINILCIGDSITSNGVWVAEVNRRIKDCGGDPIGLGFSNISFIGNCQKDDVGYEAFGGWTWNSFTKEYEGAMWVESPNNRTQEDQHSLWKDENGAIWQLETLQIDYLKFNRYQDHNSPRPDHGVLTHYKNAANQESIPILSSSTEKSSPFLNKSTKKIDFIHYAQSSGFDSIDAAYILLGTNGLMRKSAMSMSRHEYCKLVVEEARVLVDKLKQDFPNIKVKIISPQLPSPNGAMGYNYGADLPFTNGFNIKHYIFELKLAYQKWVNEPGYEEFMELIDMTGQFDSENNYPCTDKPVNTRSKKTEKIDTNACHPTTEGYMQIADAVFRNIVKQFLS